MNKVVGSAKEALSGVKDNMTILVGGFGLCGITAQQIFNREY